MRVQPIVAVMLAVSIHLTPRAKGQQRPDAQQQQAPQQRRTVTPAPDQDNRPQQKTESSQGKPPAGDESSQRELVIIGIVTALVIGWQSFETRRSADATRLAAEANLKQIALAEKTLVLQFRPRVSIRGMRLTETDTSLFAEIIVVNKGGTVATLRPTHLRFTWEYHDKTDLDESSPLPMDGGTLLPGTQTTFLIDLESISSAYAFSRHHSGAMRLRCDGVLLYADAVGIERRTGISRLYNAKTRRWEPSDQTEDEYED